MASYIPSNPHPPSGIRVIIVGAGFAGLTAGIECYRKGHSPIILESFKELKTLGDIISFGSNAGKIFERWPGVTQALDPIIMKTSGLHYRSYLGDYLFYQSWLPERSYGKAFNGHRGEIHEIVYNHALSLGIKILLGQDVTEYFETEIEAGVVSNGERIVGDVVLAADGVRSKGRTLVLGYEDAPKSSGYAIYRAWFDAKEILANPRTRFLSEDGDTHTAWLGPDIHFIVATIKGGTYVSWVFTHKVSHFLLLGYFCSLLIGQCRCRRRLEYPRQGG
jgi:2-polyprenyl-6-methoxyphenol hydroxylase-like FAD-dependent oxidoreductase